MLLMILLNIIILFNIWARFLFFFNSSCCYIFVLLLIICQATILQETNRLFVRKKCYSSTNTFRLCNSDFFLILDYPYFLFLECAVKKYTVCERHDLLSTFSIYLTSYSEGESTYVASYWFAVQISCFAWQYFGSSGDLRYRAGCALLNPLRS